MLILLIKAFVCGIVTGLIIVILLNLVDNDTLQRLNFFPEDEVSFFALGTIITHFIFLNLINSFLYGYLCKSLQAEGSFFIACGLMLALISLILIKYYPYNRYNHSSHRGVDNSLLSGLISSIINPLSPCIWLIISCTFIRAWYNIGKVYYYIYIYSILLGVYLFFLILQILTLRGFIISNNRFIIISKRLLFNITLIIGIIILIFGVLKLFYV